MAEEKEKSPDKDVWVLLEEILVILVAIYLCYRAILGIKYGIDYFFVHRLDQDSLLRRFYADPSLRNLRRMSETSPFFHTLYICFLLLKYFLYLIAAFFIGAIIWLFRKVSQGNDEEYKELSTPGIAHVEEDPGKKRWRRIVLYAQSENPSDWKLAILEADIILDEILDVNGYRGETIGEKLKKVEQGDMDTLNDAWEAHKIRNAIAHEGENFVLTPREARRVIGLYENVFKEYEFI